ncbi:ATP-binding protein [Streptomyces morookaense]|nr:sensor histidine kinase [Streptomyces morookaense]GHF15233.1 two-component sensor histidine kinase [Streptomyces morookaense]
MNEHDDPMEKVAESPFARVGKAPEDWRHLLIKACWTLLYMSYLYYAVDDLRSGRHSTLAVQLGWIGLAAFVAGYFYLVLAPRPEGYAPRRTALLAGLYVLAVTLTLTMGGAWTVLLVYVSISSGVMLPLKWSLRSVPLVSLTVFVLGTVEHAATVEVLMLVLPTFLGGAAMIAVMQMGRTMRELREARATVAHLAANEERLRLARDLHDLLGHSLSLITLKSELAGRMLPEHPEKAAQQVADIEKVSRQALVDVREAVSGFRRPTLESELAGARTALAAAGIAVDLAKAPARHPDLASDAEGALAWALREAVTNVVRHSGARRCEVTIAEQDDELCLTVADDGHGPGGPYGNGLTGLTERLALADGRLETGPARGGGFRLRACVPLSRRAASRPPTLSV